MPVCIRNYVKVLIAACLVISFCLVEGDAQTRRKKKRARHAAPAAPKPVAKVETPPKPVKPHAVASTAKPKPKAKPLADCDKPKKG